MKTVKSKILLVVILLMSALGIAIVFMSAGVYRNYKKLRMGECRSLVDLAGEGINKKIGRLQENAESLAMVGGLYCRSKERASELSEYAVKYHFQDEDVAVGGGIWFEPHVIDPERARVCFYAYNDGDGVIVDKNFENPHYDYQTQSWYLSIKKQLEDGQKTGWTVPYFDNEGTRALMTTVGVGIYDSGKNFIGMSTVDWKLDSIAKSISAIKPTKSSFALFADIGNDSIIALSDRRMLEDPVGNSLEMLPWLEAEPSDEGEMSYDGSDYLYFKRMLDNNMLIVVNVPKGELFKDIHESMRNIILALFAAFILISATTYLLLNRFINTPIAILSQKAAEIGAGNFDVRIDLGANDELGRLADSFNLMAADIKARVRNLKKMTAEKERIETELDLAREIQASLLPSIYPPFPERDEFDIYATMKPAKEVGGDFFDFFLIDENHLGIVIADVSDKGVPAALFMMITKTIIKNFALMKLDAAEILMRANKQLCENNEAGMFVTVFLGVLNVQTGEFSYSNAGHNPPYMRRRGGCFKMMELPKGLVLAGMDDSVYKLKKICLNAGDRLFLYTDGVTEAFNKDKALFGDERLFGALEAHCDAGVMDVLKGVSQSVSDFADGAYQNDDITMLGLIYFGSRIKA